MQISSSHSGFNFNSVYKSVVTRQVPPPPSSVPAVSDRPESIGIDEKLAAQNQREGLLLQAAQKAAERTLNRLESLPEL